MLGHVYHAFAAHYGNAVLWKSPGSMGPGYAINLAAAANATFR